MKRSSMAGEESSSSSSSESSNSNNNKKLRFDSQELEHEEEKKSLFSKLDENLLYEILKHADARTLAVSACVSKQWNQTAMDERLWELICTRHFSNSLNYCGTAQLRSVVLALGGFRSLHSRYLSKTAATSSSSSPFPPPPLSMVPQPKAKATAVAAPPQPSKGPGPGPGKRYGKDEVHLSLSLMSIRYYEKMNFASRRTK